MCYACYIDYKKDPPKTRDRTKQILLIISFHSFKGERWILQEGKKLGRTKD